MKARAKAAAPKPASTRKAPEKKAAPAKTTRAKPARAAKRTAMLEKAKKQSADLRPVIEKMKDAIPEGSLRPWEVVSSVGRNPIFNDADQLWNACVEYFRWVDDNPLTEGKTFPTKDEVRVELLPKMRAMSIGGLCLFLDISDESWRGWKTPGHVACREEFFGVIRRVEQIIFEQKFTAAAAGLLNPAIISQELGLVQKVETTGKDGGAIQHEHKVRVVKVPLKKPATVQTRPMATPEGEE